VLMDFGIYFVRRSSVALFLEKILERLTRVFRARRTGGRRFLLHSHAHGIEGATVALIFTSNPLRDGLAAFEPAGGVEICALPARMQLETALWAAAGWFGPRRQQSSALCATRNRVCPGHMHRTRAERILLDRLVTCGLLPFLAAVLVSALTVFAV